MHLIIFLFPLFSLSLSHFSFRIFLFFRNANEMKISRKINFFMQILLRNFFFPLLFRFSSVFNDAICRVDLNILLIWLLFEALKLWSGEKVETLTFNHLEVSHSASIYGRINHQRKKNHSRTISLRLLFEFNEFSFLKMLSVRSLNRAEGNYYHFQIMKMFSSSETESLIKRNFSANRNLQRFPASWRLQGVERKIPKLQ